jgi:carboxyl-terminal processing protease
MNNGVMSSRARVLIFLISTPITALLIVGGLLGAARPEAQQAARPLTVFQDVTQKIESSYVTNVNIDAVFDGAMRGLIDGLDSSSAYLTPEEVRAYTSNAALPAGDVGVVVTRPYLRIVGVRDGSPAAKAGLQTGDIIRAIGDQPTRDMSTFAGARALRGAPGSKVTLVIIRGNAADPHPVDVVREVLSSDRVTSRKLPGGEAYVRVTSFDSGAAKAMQAAIASLGSAASNGLLIDLRGTADGAGPEGIEAARYFLKSGTIATLAGRAASDRTVTSASGSDGAFTAPVVLLVSNGTANAAEIFAAALSGNKRARLVGEPTAGIAAEQRLVQLSEGHGLWLTYRRYLQTNGDPIHERGLRPDVPVEIPVIGFEEQPKTTDDVLNAAIKELKNPGSARPAPAAAAAAGMPESRPSGERAQPPVTPAPPQR